MTQQQVRKCFMLLNRESMRALPGLCLCGHHMACAHTHTHLSVRLGQQLQPTAPVANDVIFNNDGAVALGDNAMASVVIDTIAPELHFALGLDLDPTLAVAGDAVVSHTGELAALGHSDTSVPISVDHVGDDMQCLTALDIES